MVVSSYKESRNIKPIYGYMLPNLSPSPNLYKVQSVTRRTEENIRTIQSVLDIRNHVITCPFTANVTQSEP